MGFFYLIYLKNVMKVISGGWWGIRTPGGVAPTTVFKTAAFDRSANHPKLSNISAGLSNLRFCSLNATDVAAHHSLAFGCTAFALLTRMQDRRRALSANHPKQLYHRFLDHAQFIFWHDKCQMFFVLIFDFYFCICSHYTSTPISYPFFYASKSIVTPLC